MKPKVSKATQRNFAKFQIKGMIAQIAVLDKDVLYPSEIWALTNVSTSLHSLIKEWKPKTPKGRI